MPLGQVLAIANRGEIAIRVARTARRLGWQPVALLGEPDLDSYAAREIGRVQSVGPAGSEMDVERVITAARAAGAVALHPGYGFLSERHELSRASVDAGITFIGPSPDTLAFCGDKIATREAATRAGAPILPASEPLEPGDEGAWREAAERVGFPLIAKVVSGGGGRGLRAVRDAGALDPAIRSALREASASAAGTRLYLERYLVGARHVEVQVAGNGHDAVSLGDRDCSAQRRHQKVVEEAPAFALSEQTRATLHRHAVAVAREVEFRGVGTIEFLIGRDGQIAFIEINPRLQVEHTVTEEVTGLDLVEIQLSIAEGGPLPTPPPARGHAIQARLYAEDPARDFAPSPGRLAVIDWPRLPNLRIDSGYEAGDTIPSYYDPLIGKLIALGRDRPDAIDRMRTALELLRVAGVATNRPWLHAVITNPAFRAAEHDLSIAEEITSPATSPGWTLAPAALDQLPANDGRSAWASAGPFRVVGAATQVFHGDDPGGWQATVSYEWSGDRWTASVDDGEDRVSLERWSSARLDEQISLPTSYGFEMSNRLGRWLVKQGPRPTGRKAADALDGVLRAPMPGTVVAVNVTPGARVTTGEILVLMTAMKIEITLAAPFDGVVTSVGCATGDLVGSKQTLATVAPTAESEADSD